MKRKIHHRKHKPPALQKKNSFSMYFSILRQAGGVAAVFILVSLIAPHFFSKQVPCANSISCKTSPKFEVEKNAIGIFNNKPVKAPNISLAENENPQPVLGAQTTNGEKHIFVNLSTQTLSAYEDEKLILQTPISSGLWGKTPTGEFTIWSKFRSTRMTGGSGADYYDLPNVPYVLFFSNSEVPGSAGYSTHGVYWHNNFGHAMSHGCVNMKTTDAKLLYDWADGPTDGKPGTQITIYGNPPQ